MACAVGLLCVVCGVACAVGLLCVVCGVACAVGLLCVVCVSVIIMNITSTYTYTHEEYVEYPSCSGGMGQTLTFHPVSLPFHHQAVNQAVCVCVCVCVCMCVCVCVCV